MEVLETLSRLARECQVGTVALTGAHAHGNATTSDPVEVFVTRPVCQLTLFGLRLCEETGGIVRLYDCRLLAWAHPLHLCVRWVNVDWLPALPCPRGAIARWRCPRTGTIAAVRLETLPHFRAVDGFVTTPRGEFVRVFGPPPIGGFLV